MLWKLSVAVTTGVIVMTAFAGQASAEECFTAKGKITNNAQLDGSTLGVVALRLGRKKLNCGIVGVPQFPSPPNFKHTIVCDDKAAHDEAQAQLTFNTSFLSNPADDATICTNGAVSFPFKEVSIPDPTTARGAFQGVSEEGSELIIRGHLNCDGGIIMKFKGSLCFDD